MVEACKRNPLLGLHSERLQLLRTRALVYLVICVTVSLTTHAFYPFYYRFAEVSSLTSCPSPPPSIRLESPVHGSYNFSSSKQQGCTSMGLGPFQLQTVFQYFVKPLIGKRQFRHSKGQLPLPRNMVWIHRAHCEDSGMTCYFVAILKWKPRLWNVLICFPAQFRFRGLVTRLWAQSPFASLQPLVASSVALLDLWQASAWWSCTQPPVKKTEPIHVQRQDCLLLFPKQQGLGSKYPT